MSNLTVWQNGWASAPARQICQICVRGSEVCDTPVTLLVDKGLPSKRSNAYRPSNAQTQATAGA